MIRKNLIKSLSVVMAAMLAIMTVGCGQTTVNTAEETAQVQEQQLEDSIVSASSVSNSESEAGKVETVYVTADANGAVSDVIVSEWLKNATASSSLTDVTELKDIVNVKGSETFTQNDDGTVTWNADGSDIYYQGTTDKELPVSMKITYTLDGKEISPEELAGKSGKVTIRFDYENNAKQSVKVDGKDIEVYTPFAMVSGMMLDSDKFTNVEISNGKVISDGGNYIVMGVALPGLKESLDISDEKWDEIENSEEIEEKLSNSFEITADTTDFELGMTVTMASSDILADFGLSDLSDSDEIEKLKGDMGELRDGSEQLVDGTHTLKDGTTELKDGTQALYDGTTELKNGTADLFDGTGKLYTGTSDLYDGTQKLSDGIGAYTDGASQLNDGASKLAAGAKDLKAGTAALKSGMDEKDLVANSQKLANGAAQVSGGVNEIAGMLNSLSGALAGVSELENQYKAVHAAYQYVYEGAAWNAYTGAGMQILSKGAITTEAQYLTLKGQAEAVENGVGTVSGGLEQLNTTVKTMLPNNAMNVQTVKSGVLYDVDDDIPVPEPTEDPIPDDDGDDETDPKDVIVPENTDDPGNGDVPAPVDENTPVPNTDNTPNTDDTPAHTPEADVPVPVSEEVIIVTSGNDGGHTLTDEEWAQYQAILAQYETIKAQGQVLQALPQIASSIDALAQGSAQLPAGMEAVEKYNELCGAIQSADTVMGQIMSQLSAAGDISFDQESVNKLTQLVQGAQMVAAGNAELASGMTTLYNGAVALDNGAGQLYSGANQLSEGTATLVSNNAALKDGIAQLKDGAYQLYDGAGQLNDGASKLNDGAAELNNGAKELNDGATKLDDGVQELLDGVCKLDEEGIEKLYEAFDGDLTDFADRLTAIQQAGSNYTSFGGTEEGVDSSAKFIIKTESIKSL